MAIRVRKLARELQRTPSEVLGLLHALGYKRFRTSHDMVSEAVAGRLRDELKTLSPRSPDVVRERRMERQAARPGPGDPMGHLVPGVVRAQKEERWLQGSIPTQDGERAGARVAEGPPGAGDRAREREDLARERARLEDERAQLELDRAHLQAQRVLLDGDRAQLEADRAQLEAGRSATAASDVELPALAQLMEARGLLGADEQERALAALAGQRLLRAILPHLSVAVPDVVQGVLKDRLVLVDGEAPAGLAVAAVTVSSSRAEMPGREVLDPSLSRVGELALLNGLRRIVLVGVPAPWHPVLRRGIDPRVELVHRPAGQVRTRGDAETDVTRTDAVVLWQVKTDAEAEHVYATSRAVVVRSESADLAELLSDLLRSLE